MKDKLIVKLNKGNVYAFEQIIRRYNNYVFYVIRNHSGGLLNEEDIEELASDTFIALWKNRIAVDPEKPIMPYLAVISKNNVMNKLRSLKLTLNIEDVVLHDDDFDQGFETAATIKDILNAAHSLGDKQRELFIRFYFYGEPLKNIARAMDISDSDAKTSLYRARKAIKEHLTERGYFNE